MPMRGKTVLLEYRSLANNLQAAMLRTHNEVNYVNLAKEIPKRIKKRRYLKKTKYPVPEKSH